MGAHGAADTHHRDLTVDRHDENRPAGEGGVHASADGGEVTGCEHLACLSAKDRGASAGRGGRDPAPSADDHASGEDISAGSGAIGAPSDPMTRERGLREPVTCCTIFGTERGIARRLFGINMTLARSETG